jgi:putative aldouronate transport system permease protein
VGFIPPHTRRFQGEIFNTPLLAAGILYFLIRSLGLIDSFLVYIIPGILSFYSALLFMANYHAIPSSIEESAFIDGARPFVIFLRIVLPLSTPILAAIALFNGVAHWNDWFTTAIYTKSQWLNTLPVLLRDIINYTNNQQEIAAHTALRRDLVTLEAIRYATMMVAVLPITLSYPFLQKYFVKGMLMGAIKA